MGRPKVLPIRDNRQRALDYWIRFRRSEKLIEANVAVASKEAARMMANDSHNWATAIVSSGTVAGFNLALAADNIIAGRASGWQDAMDALAIGYLSSELMRHQRERTLGLYCRRSVGPDDLYYVAFYGGLAGLRLWPQADCLCRHLMNFWLGRGADEGFGDQEDYLSFYWFLLRAQFKGEWPEMDELDAGELGEFYPLFATVSNPEAFREALVEYCDFRLARMHEYSSQHAKRRNDSLLSDALTYGPLLLLPAELLAFKAIYERVTAKTCDLHAEHPLIKTGLLDPPAGLSLPENDLTACLHETGKAVFGSAWQPGALVEVRFDNPPVLPDETPASQT
jgi:hypothetical protein